jgi:Sulfotransferase family
VSDALRLPDVVIVGAMKSATSTLFWWLDHQPEIVMAHPKETNFFTTRWSNGVTWYAAQFTDALSGQLLGEASVNYTNPELSTVAAERMARMIPGARLIYVLRHPVDRIRSHYRHEVQRHREFRPLLDVLREPGNAYVGHSAYHSCFAPYIERFPRDQLLVVRFEDLVRRSGPAWSAVLRFLSLPERPMPEDAHNVGSEHRQWTGAFAFAMRHRLVTFPRIARLPMPIRRFGKRIVTRGGRTYESRLEASEVPIPDELLRGMWADVARLESWLGSPLWSPDRETVPLQESG